MPDPEIPQGMPNAKLARALVKELAKSMLEEDRTLAGQVQKMLGGEPPVVYTIDLVDVLLEPLHWLVVFQARHLTMLDLRDDLGIRGRVPVAFQEALRAHFRATCMSSLTPWQEEKIARIVEGVISLGIAYIRYPTPVVDSLHAFLIENKMVIEAVRDTITHLEWDRVKKMHGKAAATKFLSKSKMRASSFSRHNRSFVTALSSEKNSGGGGGFDPSAESEPEEESAPIQPNPPKSTAPRNAKKGSALNSKKKKKK